jgi:hypothetical protein
MDISKLTLKELIILNKEIYKQIGIKRIEELDSELLHNNQVIIDCIELVKCFSDKAPSCLEAIALQMQLIVADLEQDDKLVIKKHIISNYLNNTALINILLNKRITAINQFINSRYVDVCCHSEDMYECPSIEFDKKLNVKDWVDEGLEGNLWVFKELTQNSDYIKKKLKERLEFLD